LWSLLSTPLVVFLPHCRNNKNLSEKQKLRHSRVSTSISNYLITRIQIQINKDFNNLVDTFPEDRRPAPGPPAPWTKAQATRVVEFRSLELMKQDIANVNNQCQLQWQYNHQIIHLVLSNSYTCLDLPAAAAWKRPPSRILPRFPGVQELHPII